MPTAATTRIVIHPNSDGSFAFAVITTDHPNKPAWVTPSKAAWVPLPRSSSLRCNCRCLGLSRSVTHLFREWLSVEVRCIRSLPNFAEDQHPHVHDHLPAVNSPRHS